MELQHLKKIFFKSMADSVKSKRGREKFCHDGYIYRFDKSSKTQDQVKFWRCHEDGRCRARIHTLEREVIKRINEHTHPPSAIAIEVENVLTDARDRAERTCEPPSTIINKCIEKMSVAGMAQLPNRQAMRKIIRRKRNEVNQVPENPRSIQELQLPEEYMLYKPTPDTNENFCLMDRGAGSERIIIFGRESWLEHIATSKIWYADGTFAVAPQLFYQVYIILVKKNNGVHPVLYALLQNKQYATYVRLFEMVKEMSTNTRPDIINCDFERAAFTAMKDSFPSVEVRGCLFHLSQNLLKQLSGFGLMNLYNTNPDFALHAKMITALCFVPVDDLDTHVDSLAGNLPEELIPVLNWFEDNYIGRPNRRGAGRRSPLFPTEMWNMHQRTLDGDDRTNNYAEAGNRRLKSELGMLHPTIWKFIDVLRQVQKGRDEYFEKLSCGHEPELKLLRYRKADERILKIVSEYGIRNEIEYLRSIAHNLMN